VATAVESRDYAHPAIRSNGSSPSGSTRGQSLAQGLGWFSIGLGLAEILAPNKVADMIGLEDNDRNIGVLRAMGMREIASGLGIFSQRNDGAFLWSRVAGDALDLALLGAAMTDERNDRNRLIGAAVAVAGAAALDVLVARQRSNPEVTEMQDDAPTNEQHEGVRIIRRSITINGSVEQVGDALDRYASQFELKRIPDAQVSVCQGPRDGEVEVQVEVAWEPRMGKAGAATATMLRRDPASQLYRELRHLKQLVEVGEIVHSDSSIHRGPHPAKPSREARV
jgi:hypothetical protein